MYPPQQPMQPMQQPYPPAGVKPPNYLVWSILTTIFCCLPLGVVSIIFAAQVDGKYTSGDYAGAMNASRMAKNFAIAAAIAGIVVIILYFILVGASIATFNFSTGFSTPTP